MPSDIVGRAGLRAVILAAGVGRRMAEGAAGLPKALLRFGAETLLTRHLAILSQAGVADITLVTGFGAQHILAALPAPDPGCRVAALHNPDFGEGSVVSLWTARAVLRGGGGAVLMDADVLYDARMMARLLDSPHANCLLLDRDIEPGDEPVKLCIRDGKIVDFRKRPARAYDWHGESVGFFRFDSQTAAELADRAEDYVRTARRDMEYEEPIRDMIIESAPGRFGFEDISGMPWTEIDFPEDLSKAARLVTELA